MWNCVHLISVHIYGWHVCKSRWPSIYVRYVHKPSNISRFRWLMMNLRSIKNGTNRRHPWPWGYFESDRSNSGLYYQLHRLYTRGREISNFSHSNPTHRPKGFSFRKVYSETRRGPTNLTSENLHFMDKNMRSININCITLPAWVSESRWVSLDIGDRVSYIAR